MHGHTYERICLCIVGATEFVSSRDNPSRDLQMFDILNLRHVLLAEITQTRHFASPF